MRGLSQGCEKSVSADPPPSREPDSGRPDSGLGDAWRGAEALILGTGDEAGARIRDLRHAMEVCGARVTTRLRPLFPEGGRDRLGALAFGRGLLRLPSLHRALLEALPPAPPDIIIIPYPGHLDAPALAPRLRERYGPKTRIALDLFVGLHETLVLDRARVPVGSWRAGALLGLDRRAAASVDILITDTREHGRLWTDSGIIARGGSDGGAEPVVVRLGGDPRSRSRSTSKDEQVLRTFFKRYGGNRWSRDAKENWLVAGKQMSAWAGVTTEASGQSGSLPSRAFCSGNASTKWRTQSPR